MAERKSSTQQPEYAYIYSPAFCSRSCHPLFKTWSHHRIQAQSLFTDFLTQKCCTSHHPHRNRVLVRHPYRGRLKKFAVSSHSVQFLHWQTCLSSAIRHDRINAVVVDSGIRTGIDQSCGNDESQTWIWATPG
jgi:hypothetical protein